MVTTKVGFLCGRGDISITSIAGAGEDDGRGGVVIMSSIYLISGISLTIDWSISPYALAWPSMLAVNKDRRGVASWGLNIVSSGFVPLT